VAGSNILDPTMPRKVRDSNLETRTARSRLKARHKPFFRLIEPGLHLGYRKLASGPGTWLARRYSGEGKYTVENLRTPDGALIIADDYSEADGHAVLSFGQAQERAKTQRSDARKPTKPYTVADAMDEYLVWLESEGRSATAITDARYRDRAFIRPKLGELEVASLTADRLRQWRDALAKAAPRLRTRAGERQKHRELANDDETRRSRRASANRTWTTLRAALNHAFQADKVESDKAWRKVKPFKGVDKARVRYLSVAEAKRLINASDEVFRPLVQAALLTGGRYGQIAQLTVSDFNEDAGTLRMRTRKGDGSERIHHVHLTAEGVGFFERASAGRTGADLIFTKGDGSAWRKSHQVRPIEEASARAKISPPANFHVTRHTWASHAVMNGMPLLVVAKSLGHADTRMVELHYGHLAPSYVADAIRAGAPRFGIRADTKVTSLRGRHP
jgi:integrase